MLIIGLIFSKNKLYSELFIETNLFVITGDTMQMQIPSLPSSSQALSGKTFLCFYLLNCSQKRKPASWIRTVCILLLLWSILLHESNCSSKQIWCFVFSDVLREALGLQQNQLAPFVYQMRMLGYPPGWMEEAKAETSGLAMYDKEGKGKYFVEASRKNDIWNWL